MLCIFVQIAERRKGVFKGHNIYVKPPSVFFSSLVLFAFQSGKRLRIDIQFKKFKNI